MPSAKPLDFGVSEMSELTVPRSDVLNPSTDKVIAQVSEASARDVDVAVYAPAATTTPH